MSQTIVETYPLHEFTFSSNKPLSSEQNCQVINQKISHKGCCQKAEASEACPAPAKTRANTCGTPGMSVPGHCGKGAKGGGGGGGGGTPFGERVLGILEGIREPLAEYQERQGLGKTEQYGFTALISALGQHAYSALVTIFTMLYNLLPVLEGFLYLARFVLDKLIEICKTPDTGDKILKSVLFIGEMGIIVIVVTVLCGFILYPVWSLFSVVIGKILTIIISNV